MLFTIELSSKLNSVVFDLLTAVICNKGKYSFYNFIPVELK